MIHLLLFSIPVTFAVKNRPSIEKKIELRFEKPPKKIKKKHIKAELKPIYKEVRLNPKRMNLKPAVSQIPISPIESEVIGEGGINIPVGEVYDAPYILPVEKLNIEPVQIPIPIQGFRDYLLFIKKKIERNKRYPSYAKLEEIEGRVGVSFTLFKNGNVDKIEIKESSGKEILDKSAISTIKRSSPFPPVPEILKDKAPLPICVDIVYELKNL